MVLVLGTGIARVRVIAGAGARARVTLGAAQDGNTPLHVALMKGHVEVANRLIEAGASGELKNKVRRARGGAGGPCGGDGRGRGTVFVLFSCVSMSLCWCRVWGV